MSPSVGQPISPMIMGFILLQCPYKSVMVGIKHAVICSCAIDHWGRCAIEEGIIYGKVWISVEADKGVDVDSEGRSIVTKELHDGEHEVTDIRAEIAVRRLARW